MAPTEEEFAEITVAERERTRSAKKSAVDIRQQQTIQKVLDAKIKNDLQKEQGKKYRDESNIKMRPRTVEEAQSTVISIAKFHHTLNRSYGLKELEARGIVVENDKFPNGVKVSNDSLKVELAKYELKERNRNGVEVDINGLDEKGWNELKELLEKHTPEKLDIVLLHPDHEDCNKISRIIMDNSKRKSKK